MSHAITPAVASTLLFAAALAAQDAPPAASTNPKTAAHERLAALVGEWRTDTQMAAMPGVPGMEKASAMVGTERAELICNGLWLQVRGEGTCDGTASTGLWLLGYDSYANVYQCVAVYSMDESPCSFEATYDEPAKTWHFHGETPMGPFRSEFVLESADRSIETAFGKDADGKEFQFMRSVRTRAKGAAAKEAAAATAAPAADAASSPPELAALLADVGAWDADFRMEMPGAPAMTAKCREVVTPICGGKWTWSTFTGELMGAPFEGHALSGYDGRTHQVVSFWMDSMNAAFMRTDGTYDAQQRTFAMRGTCYDEQGRRGPVASTSTSSGKDARQLRMVFGDGPGQRVMTIAYRRAGM